MKMNLRYKIIGVVLLAALLPMFVIFGLSIMQREQASELINDAMEEMIIEDLTHIMQDFYSLCRTANDFTQQYVNYSLNIAREEIYRKGPVELLAQKISWRVKNQFSGRQAVISIPKMAIGGAWLGQNEDLNIHTIVVDKVKNLLGATCTIFQLMNDRGDMLRVATNVETLAGTRAIGTCIPALNPDSTENTVVATIMKGEAFRGRAYVVNDWYLTAYEPIKDKKGKIIGMFYVGVKQESAESFRESILQTRVGQNGYLYALGGSGNHKGQYIISKLGKNDGDHLLDKKDAAGNYFIQEIINHSKKLKEGEIGKIRYNLEYPEENTYKKIISLYTYFEPWDWVIGANAYEEDYHNARDKVDNVISNLVIQTSYIGLIILVLVTFLTLYMVSKIARPIMQMARASNELASGNIHQTIEYSGDDEVGILANSYNTMSKEIREQREVLQETNNRLTEANATKDKFFSIIAHDLKNPFNTLLTYSATLVKQYDRLPPEKIKKGLETLYNNSNRGYNLLVDLLGWARSQSGNIELALAKIDITQIAEENVAILNDRAKDKGIEIYSQVDAYVFAFADRNMVSTVIRNLLTNAVKFTPAGGEVKIISESNDDFIKITISDSGIGISAENIKKLFRLDTFYRTLGTDNEKGTGLGLILCKEFIEKLNGEIWVESKLGQGSRFNFTLPQNRDNEVVR